MADTLTRVILEDGPRRAVVRVQLNCDGTGSTDAILVDRSVLVAPEAARLVIEKVDFSIDGMTIALEFDHTTDDHIASLTGWGEIDFTMNGRYHGYVDPDSAGGTGDIVGTTTGHSNGDTATLVFWLRKKY